MCSIATNSRTHLSDFLILHCHLSFFPQKAFYLKYNKYWLLQNDVLITKPSVISIIYKSHIYYYSAFHTSEQTRDTLNTNSRIHKFMDGENERKNDEIKDKEIKRWTNKHLNPPNCIQTHQQPSRRLYRSRKCLARDWRGWEWDGDMNNEGASITVPELETCPSIAVSRWRRPDPGGNGRQA